MVGISSKFQFSLRSGHRDYPRRMPKYIATPQHILYIYLTIVYLTTLKVV